MTTGHTSSFAFLAPYGPLYRQLATVAESALALDPRLALLKLRQLAEAFAQALAIAEAGTRMDPIAACTGTDAAAKQWAKSEIER
jgi:hypothetical protein